ncbi:hypothetical protein M5D96_003607 [Drosophila gunungcola]|uniref:Uncharacterized protein n=1 Tax=Drosophila gunungcola TaxID=103775 RepID=A0A9Q0BSI3_9MUSC|nr:hypothetical protein M5D96_003607 [Drosophila gunungcola]
MGRKTIRTSTLHREELWTLRKSLSWMIFPTPLRLKYPAHPSRLETGPSQTFFWIFTWLVTGRVIYTKQLPCGLNFQKITKKLTERRTMSLNFPNVITVTFHPEVPMDVDVHEYNNDNEKLGINEPEAQKTRATRKTLKRLKLKVKAVKKASSNLDSSGSSQSKSQLSLG